MPSPDRVRVLVVDDDEEVREAIAHVLVEEGFDVVGLASDGREGVARARALTPDAVVLDVRMPHVGGIEAARRIRPLSATMRIVMLSAYDDPALQREAAEAGATSFLVKGCPLSELIEAVSG